MSFDTLPQLIEQIRIEAAGFIGGVLFFGSWLLQAWESKKAGHPIVSTRFFAMRASASVALAAEGWRAGSLSVFLMMSATLVLMLYNIWLKMQSQKG